MMTEMGLPRHRGAVLNPLKLAYEWNSSYSEIVMETMNDLLEPAKKNL